VIEGTKTFECRLNDREFQAGDKVRLLEYKRDRRVFTGRWVEGRINYILHNFEGLLEHFVIFSFEKERSGEFYPCTFDEYGSETVGFGEFIELNKVSEAQEINETLLERMERASSLVIDSQSANALGKKAWYLDQIFRALNGEDYEIRVQGYKAQGMHNWDEGVQP
jgi:hypothetical protein